MPDLLLVIIGTVLVNHFVLERRETGQGDFVADGLATRLELAVDSGCAFLIAAAILLPLDRWLLLPFGFFFLQPLALAGSCAIGTLLVRMFRSRTGGMRPAIVTAALPMANSAMLVVALQHVTGNQGPFETLASAVSLAIGFGLILLAFAELLQRVDHPQVPAAFRGMPLTLVTAGLAALALLGLA